MEKKNERIFISYKRVDMERVDALRKAIEQATGETCWIDRDGIESDAQFVSVIMDAIDQCEIFLFMRSKEHNNITDYRTDWTVREVNYALQKKKRIVFISLDNAPLPDWFEFMFPNQQEIDASDATKLEHFYTNMRSWLNVEKGKEVVIKNKKTIFSNKTIKTISIVGFILTFIGISYLFIHQKTPKEISDTYVSDCTNPNNFKHASIIEDHDTTMISLNLPFLVGSTELFMDTITQQKINMLIQYIKSNEGCLDGLEIMTAFSPEGLTRINRQLAEARAKWFGELLQSQLEGITPTASYIEYNWKDVANILREQGHETEAKQIDDIIDQQGKAPYHKIRTIPTYEEIIMPALSPLRYVVCRIKMVRLKLKENDSPLYTDKTK